MKQSWRLTCGICGAYTISPSPTQVWRRYGTHPKHTEGARFRVEIRPWAEFLAFVANDGGPDFRWVDGVSA